MSRRGAGRRGSAATVAALALVVMVAIGEAGTFRFEDAGGNVYYTNVPTDPRYRRVPGLPVIRNPVPFASGAVPTRIVVGPYGELIRSAAERHRVDARLVEAVVTVESGGNPRAVSPKGAQGLMQLMPQRAARLGVRKPFDPGQNVDGGVRHLRELLQRFGGDLTLALAAYNAGEEAVRAYGGVPPFAETQEYIRRVRALYEGLDGPGPAWAVRQAPQTVYRRVTTDGSIVYTNLPPRPTATLKPAF